MPVPRSVEGDEGLVDSKAAARLNAYAAGKAERAIERERERERGWGQRDRERERVERDR